MTTAETSFGRWIRSNRTLSSANGYCVYDIDYIVHKFRTDEYKRDWQLLMMVEAKTRNSNVSDAQRDSLYILSQLRFSHPFRYYLSQNYFSVQIVYLRDCGFPTGTVSKCGVVHVHGKVVVEFVRQQTSLLLSTLAIQDHCSFQIPFRLYA
jgi:hypothetical protein